MTIRELHVCWSERERDGEEKMMTINVTELFDTHSHSHSLSHTQALNLSLSLLQKLNTRRRG